MIVEKGWYKSYRGNAFHYFSRGHGFNVSYCNRVHVHANRLMLKPDEHMGDRRRCKFCQRRKDEEEEEE